MPRLQRLKMLARDEPSSLFCFSVGDKEKRFIRVTPGHFENVMTSPVERFLTTHIIKNYTPSFYLEKKKL